jgi:hypothetical protein
MTKICVRYLEAALPLCGAQPKDFGARPRGLTVALRIAVSLATMGRAAIFVTTDVIG